MRLDPAIVHLVNTKESTKESAIIIFNMLELNGSSSYSSSFLSDINVLSSLQRFIVGLANPLLIIRRRQCSVAVFQDQLSML